MWTPATRRQHSRDELRYETDLTDAEWALLVRPGGVVGALILWISFLDRLAHPVTVSVTLALPLPSAKKRGGLSRPKGS
jgi:hypothetical protein